MKGHSDSLYMSAFKKKPVSSPESKNSLVEKNVSSSQELMKLHNLKSKGKDKVLSVLMDEGHISEQEMIGYLSQKYNCQVIQLEDFEISKEVLQLVPQKICEKYTVIPVSRVGDTLVVACIDPSNVYAKEQLLFTTGCKIEFVLAEKNTIKDSINALYGGTEEEMGYLFAEIEESSLKFRRNQKKQIEEEEDEDVAVIRLNKNDPEPVVRCVNSIVSSAIYKKSSDIHIESYEKTCRIRFRVDGKLQEMFHPPKSIAPFIISRIKVMSRLDIGEKRKPQDGRIKLSLDGGKELNFRVSVAPTIGGEKIVLRILDDSALAVDVKQLGMTEDEMKIFLESLHVPQGLILVTGPTGSGKTTTIYSGLQLLNTKERNISTAEDPVEFKLDGINQVQVHQKIGLTFAATLRSFLRQDPDVMFVGEIRDYETAETAFKAASTGHLVVSTIHTNDTPSTITRLVDIGVPDYSIADNVTLIVGQRLLRKICKRCKVIDTVSSSALATLGLSEEQIKNSEGKIKRGKGCKTCSYIGYRGRIAVFEMLQITDSVRDGIFKKLSPMELKHKVIASGDLKTVRQSGIDKMLSGLVSFEEVLYGTKADFR